MAAGGETTVDHDADEDLVARLAVATKWSPNDVLDAPPKVLDKVIVLVVEEGRRRAREQLQARLKRRGR